MKFQTILPAFALLVISTSASARSVDGSFAIKDFGAHQCSQYVTQIKSNNESQANRYVGWIAGYFSAINEVSPETFDYLSWQNLRTLSLMLLNHCQQNPQERFATAVVRLKNTLKKQRLLAPSPMVKIPANNNFIYIYQESLRQAQRQLIQAGYNPGKADGLFGQTTAAALKQFQSKNKLPVTGLPDQPTLHLLMRNQK